ncbi:hypothetical protein SG34_000245 [Thalassomonas viridans]|uniref:Uncharacterized protein n=1 Tax=Thalassomonas viridans TaxID=137584 RepID=A0AAE9Z2L2_9GAMM|nr:hypothetical protein [Thalassomonas viridans]WDE05418.1 hypothetical protein SG34_000245 [Thalassomonas viridans]
MKKAPYLLALLLPVFSSAALADTVYVGGTMHTLNKADFSQSGNNYTANIDVIGDYGQELIFNVDAKVAGKGAQDVHREWRCLLPRNAQPGQWCAEPDWLITYDQDFRYQVEMKITCSGIAIGSDMDNKNELVNGFVANKDREVKLLVNKRITTDGNCQQLKVEVNGVDVKAIDNIDLNMFIVEEH